MGPTRGPTRSLRWPAPRAGWSPSRGVIASLEYDGAAPVLNQCREPGDGNLLVPYGGEVVLGMTNVPVSDPDDCETED